MAVRKLDTGVWDDPRVIGLSCTGKLVYMYLLTTPRGNLLGCFECTVPCLARDTGLSHDEAKGALDELVEGGLVDVDADSGGVLVTGWSKVQWGRSPRVAKAVRKAIGEVASARLSCVLEAAYSAQFPTAAREDRGKADCVDAGQIPYAYSMDTIPIPYPYGMGRFLREGNAAGQMPYRYGMHTVSIPYAYTIVAMGSLSEAAGQIPYGYSMHTVPIVCPPEIWKILFSDISAGQILYAYGIGTRRSIDGYYYPNNPNPNCVENPPNLPNQPGDQRVAVTRPTLAEIERHAEASGLAVDCKAFFDVNEARDWKIDGRPIRSWKALLASWARPKEAQPRPVAAYVASQPAVLPCPTCSANSWTVPGGRYECPKCGIWAPRGFGKGEGR